MPKVLLHEHLDGGLRTGTLLTLLKERSIDAPAANVRALDAWFRGRAHAGNLPDYLAGFGLTVAAMASPAGLERVAFEAAEDARLDGCVLAEFRVAPTLFEAHGVSAEASIEALLGGLKRSELPCGLILCAMRQHDPAEGLRTAQLALRYRAQGVIGFDLAGPELGFPPMLHRAALNLARHAELPITCHAGEADCAERVMEAAELGARRIGHGIRLIDALREPTGEALRQDVIARGLHLELCPTSNVHTGAAESLATHPIRALWESGIRLSFHTDNRLMSCISPSVEAAQLLSVAGFSWADLVQMSVFAAQDSFMPRAARERAQSAILTWARAEGIVVQASEGYRNL